MRELIVDSFAGGGGASLGIAWATGRAPDVAINHDEHAIAMHRSNHPSTLHLLEDVWKAKPQSVTKGRPVGLLWASPDCKHFSRAKGGKPVNKTIRSLAWVIHKWAVEVKPRLIVLENVREFEDWGPLVPQLACKCGWKGTQGQAALSRRGRPKCPRCENWRLKETGQVPDPDRKGLTFRRFVGRLRNLGYQVSKRVLNAADYGAPTHRRRLFLVARCDGERIIWPDPTHTHPEKVDEFPLLGRLKPWRAAAECIDWSLPCPSIFERKRPLAEKTLRRIAMGIKRYVIDNPRPFIVRCNHGGEHFRGQSCDQPMCTLTSSRDAHGLISPVLAKYHGQKGNESRCQVPDGPFATLDTQNRYGLIAPSVMRIGHYGGNGHYTKGADEPLTTITSKAEHCAVCAKVEHVAAFIAKHFGGVVGVPVETPLPTTCAKGAQNQLVAANLVHMSHGDKQWNDVRTPLRTVTSNNHAALVYSFLVKYFGTAIGQKVDEPMHTQTGKHRFGVITIELDGEPYAIVDIGMRMLTPRELARAQGFPDTYELPGTKTQQVAAIGNSVCPQVARAIVEANYSREGTPCTGKERRDLACREGSA